MKRRHLVVRFKSDSHLDPTVEDLMTTDIFTLMEDDNMGVLKELMRWKNIRHVPVVDNEGQLVGIVTHRDFLRVAISQLADVPSQEITKLYQEIKVGEIMNRDVLTAHKYTSLPEAARIMTVHKYGCLPVVENRKLVGIITEADFVQCFFDPQEPTA